MLEYFHQLSAPVQTLIIYSMGSLMICILMFLTKNKLVDSLLFIPFIGLQIYLNVMEYFEIGITKADGLEDYFKIDHLGFIFLTLTTLISIPVIIHSTVYSFSQHESKKELEVHNISLLLFIANMSGAIISCNVGLMWAFLEATTLCASMLIYHERNAEALEAAWKYVFVCSIGIALTFVGILFLGMANKSIHELNFSIEGLKLTVAHMDSIWLKLSFLFIITGYSVKIGVVPLFTVDIDAKDAAPSPVGALLSGGLMNVGILALLRFYQIFGTTDILGWMNKILIIVGILSILLAAVYLFKVANYKRMLAYSSMEHAGIALIAIASGKIGFVAAILHLIFHAFTKVSLFVQMGQVYKVFQGKNMKDIGGYFQLNPLGASVILLGIFSITALPPSGLFLSEFLIFKSLFLSERYITASILFLLLTIILAALGTKFFKLLFSPIPNTTISYQSINQWESISQWIMLLTMIYAGIAPPAFLIDFISTAVKDFPTYIPL
ncbi:MAG: hypothetical protein EAZ07_07865 [Cytophagales bacterium]|nr:MAG: hypothetical protein EAZ07_07865 [Cytophagales bacterium]